MSIQENIHHIVIVGGGAGGLELATKLGKTLGRKQQARITLVDANLTHVWKPLLHEVAAGSMDYTANEVNYRAQAKWNGFEFQLGRMVGLEREKKQIHLAPVIDEQEGEVIGERIIHYDSLVIAVGSQTNDFGTPGAADNCLFLDSFAQAKRFHKVLLNSFLKANYDKVPLDIAIIGAGATGVELAAELRMASRELPVYGLNHISRDDINISLVEASPRILPALPERISLAATKELERLGIKVVTHDSVKEVQAHGLQLASGEFIPAQLKVWAAGIKAPEFLTTLDGLETARNNQLVVKQTLQTTLDESVFALGDCANCPQPDSDRPVPPRAQAAHQQATVLAKTLKRRLQGLDAVPYVYRDRGSLISFSRYGSVGNLMGNLTGKNLMIEGRVARFMYVSLYRLHQIALHGFFRTSLIWLNDKINHVIRPRLKLH
ncbi:NAD(P)/FAD-dependent oxidoreductase [Zooshikella sp. RANM57]|uniref:NAD(P)/FAD-dependent oxidoreductase n=1 Tax=Zooshikella sp. RANM57 TaxID=3425863 RepID=UPI003D6FDF88